MPAKNPGPKLYFSQYGGEQPIPPEFVAAMQRAEEVQAVVNEEPPENLSDTVVESKVETNRTNERVRRTIKKKPGNIVLRAINTNQNGQPVQIIRTLFPTGTPPAVPDVTTTVAVQDLGNGWSIQEVSQEGFYDEDGNFIPGLFLGPKYELRIPDVIPEKFAVAVPTSLNDTFAPGMAVVPVLGPGDLDKSEEQVTQFKKKLHVETRADVVIPKSLVGKNTNDNKQIVTKTETYKVAGGDEIPTATKDVEVQNLGDGRVLQIEQTIPAIFAGLRFVKNIPDVVPERFRVAVPATTSDSTVAGTAVIPTLDAGDLEKSEQQIDVFKKRLSETSRAAISLPVVLVGKDTNEVKQVVTKTETYKLVGNDALPGAKKDVEVQNLGDGRVLQIEKTIPEIFTRLRYSKDRPDVVPERFRVAVAALTTDTNVVGQPQIPSLLEGDLERSEEQVDEFVKRTHLVTRAAVDIPVSLVGKDTNEVKQIVTVTEKYKLSGDNAVPDAFQEVAVQNLGDGRVLQIVKSIPFVFRQLKFVKSVPDIVPPEFRVAVPTLVSESTIEGVAVEPTLETGDLEKTEQAIDVFKKRISTTSRGNITLPKTLIGKETSRDKKVVTVTRKLKNAGDDELPNELQDVEVENLGDGTVLQTVRKAASIFVGAEYVAAIQDTVPPEFQALVPKRTVSKTSVGTATAPDLATGEYEIRRSQTDVFKMRETTVSRDAINLPASLTDTFFGGPRDGRGSTFSGVVTKKRTIDDIILTPDVSFLAFESKVTAIGAGQYVKETDTATSYPTLTEKVTEDDGAIATKVKSIVVAGTALPTGYASQFPLDNQRTLRVVETIDSASIDVLTLRRIFNGKVNVDLPSELESITGLVTAQKADGAYNESGTYGLGGKGSGGIALNGSARGSAAIITDIKYGIRHPWSSNMPCKHYLFFLSYTNLENNGVLTYVNIIESVTVTAWPKFAPKEVIITCDGARVSAEATGNVHVTDVMTSDYNGVLKLSGFSKTAGSGNSSDIELIQKVIKIPPTIHPSLSLTIPAIISQNFVVSGVISSGVQSTTLSAAGIVTGAYAPTSIAATPGQQKIPASGRYLYQFFVEPYKAGIAKVHAITIDFVDLL